MFSQPAGPVFHDENVNPNVMPPPASVPSQQQQKGFRSFLSQQKQPMQQQQQQLTQYVQLQHSTQPASLFSSSSSSFSSSSSTSKPSMARKAQRVALCDISNQQATAAASSQQQKRAAVASRAAAIVDRSRPGFSFSSLTARPLQSIMSAATLPTSLSFTSSSSGSLRPALSIPSSSSFSIHTDHLLTGDQTLKRKAEDEKEEEEEERQDEAEDDDDDDEQQQVRIVLDVDAKDVEMLRHFPAGNIDTACGSSTNEFSSHTVAMAISPTAASSGLSSSESSLSASASSSAVCSASHSNASRHPSSHLFLTDYASPILGHLLSSQLLHLPHPQYMQQLQADLNPRMREILVDWMQEVCLKFRLQEETLFLSVSIVDRFLSAVTVGRRRLQLVGCVGMLLACKYEEMLVPEIDDFVHISDRAYSREEMLGMEADVLNALSFQLTAPSPLRFVDTIYAQQRVDALTAALPAVCASRDERRADDLRLLTVFLLNITLQHYRFLQYRPALLAVSCWLLSLSSCSPSPPQAGPSNWAQQTRALFRCAEAEVAACMADVWLSWREMRLKEGEGERLEADELVGSKYRAVERKFSKDKYRRVTAVNVVRPAGSAGQRQ